MRSPFACQHDTFVEHCPSCAELAAIERAFAEDHAALMQQAPVPTSAIMWWRAQMRSRREAERRAREPITIVQGLAVACGAGLLVALIGLFTPAFGNVAEWIMGASLPSLSVSWPTLTLPEEPLTNSLFLAVAGALALTLIVLPVALYVTFHEGE